MPSCYFCGVRNAFHCFPRTWRLPFEPRDVPGNCLFEIPRERGIVCHLAEVVVETSPLWLLQ